MKHTIFIILCIVGLQQVFGQTKESASVDQLMNNWHQAAAKADFNGYFALMDAQSIFIGTDATERWNKADFMVYAKPHFDKGKAWSFSALERHINFSADGKTAWVDELLNTQMKICRGSAVLQKKAGKWLIQHYVLSMTIPNEVVGQVLPIKAPIEDKLIEELSRKK